MLYRCRCLPPARRHFKHLGGTPASLARRLFYPTSSLFVRLFASDVFTFTPALSVAPSCVLSTRPLLHPRRPRLPRPSVTLVSANSIRNSTRLTVPSFKRPTRCSVPVNYSNSYCLFRGSSPVLIHNVELVRRPPVGIQVHVRLDRCHFAAPSLTTPSVVFLSLLALTMLAGFVKVFFDRRK
jgi:hypothetical protein